jgi:serine/threonine protein kinase
VDVKVSNPPKPQQSGSGIGRDDVSGKKSKESGKVDREIVEVKNEVVDEMIQALETTDKKKVSQEDFELLAVIGRGSFGKVMQVKHRATGQIYAMKIMRKDMIVAKNQITHTKDEKTVLQKIKHAFIVNLHFAFQTKDKLYLILDYVNGGELFFHLKKSGKFSEERVKFYSAEIASALIHLHKAGIIYRDLKPENLLLDIKGHVVITDFGLAKEVMDDGTHTFCGTPEYLAPEVLKGEVHSYPVDWWSLGTLMYEMMTGLPPFYSEVLSEMYQNIVAGDLVFPSDMSDEACDLLAGFLDRDPSTRLGGDEVKQHPFFEDVDWEALDRREVEPPWKPPVKGASDTGMIDNYFLQELAADTPSKKSTLSQFNDEDVDMFDGFTYEANGVLNTVKAGDDDDD